MSPCCIMCSSTEWFRSHGLEAPPNLKSGKQVLSCSLHPCQVKLLSGSILQQLWSSVSVLSPASMGCVFMMSVPACQPTRIWYELIKRGSHGAWSSPDHTTGIFTGKFQLPRESVASAPSPLGAYWALITPMLVIGILPATEGYGDPQFF